VLKAAGVVEVISEDERVGVLPPFAVLVADEVRLVEEVRSVLNASLVALDHSRLRLPLTPELQLAFLRFVTVEVATTALQELALVLAAVPALQVVLVGPVLAARMDELDEAASIPHRLPPGLPHLPRAWRR
jgi:hypothetical protein